jgi:spore coat protein U-like protein
MRMMTGLGILAGLALVGGPATATSVNTTFGVTLTIHADCVINSSATLAFGSLGVLGGISGSDNNDATTSLAVQCTDTTPYDIGLNEGINGGTTTTRKLLNQANGSTATVNYTLWQDAGHATNWGNAVGQDTMSLTGDGVSHSHTVYGRIPAQMTPAPGSYADTITITVTF